VDLSLIWLVFVSMSASCVEPLGGKLGFRWALAPEQLLLVRTLVGAVVIYPLTRSWRVLKRSEMPGVVAVSLLFTLAGWCLLYALRYLPASTVVTLQATTPAVVGLANRRLGKANLTPHFWLGLALSVPGVALCIGADVIQPAGLYPGLAWVAAAVACSTMYRISMDRVTVSLTPQLTSTYVFWLSILWVLPLLGELRGMPQYAWAVGTVLGVAAALANVAFLALLHRIGSTHISVVSLLQRPLTIVLSAVFLAEGVQLSQWAGILMVLGGVALTSRGIKRSPQAA
jgi:probable blue pigment (indigoidine) exporter